MKILLIGEYSNVHWTLSQGLRALGHEVTVLSDGDGWKNYPRTLDLKRTSYNRLSGIRYLLRLIRLLPRLRGYDVVQLINPMFLEIKAERMLPVYKYLRRHNGRVFLGAYGMDRYWVQAGCDGKSFRYSDFNIGNRLRESAEITQWKNEWLEGSKGRLNQYIAEDCDGIIAGLYEYWVSYHPYFGDKTTFIPFPINQSEITPIHPRNDGKVHCFIGIQKTRNAYKGTDIMLRALEEVAARYPNCEIVKAESVPFAQYQEMMNDSDLLLDQLYSYTPAMNGLLAMAKGLVLVGGGEPEAYNLLQEDTLRPIINVQPNQEDVVQKLSEIMENPDILPVLSKMSREYIKKYHDHIQVAQSYINFWKTSHKK